MGDKSKDIKAIFSEALEKKNAEERAAYLDDVCGDDATLRAEFESLLRVHDEAGDFLEAPVISLGVPPDDSSPTEAPGTVIGPYKLLELIGEGGFGAVYMAEQEEPIRRRVALKIIKLGMDTKSVIARFEAERQALAMMDHPNIAKVFEAGSTEQGRPYFAMELVRGVPVTEYCDTNNLQTQQRLELFLDICGAVEHAHQKGIIHRDIKPSNVMVALQDSKPVPKIIDFGIAKATEHRLTEKTLFTEFRQLLGTPAYMSPEQAEFSSLDIDTRTDIYSLGVLLYELLTGTAPFERERLGSASYDEICRMIRETEPPKPSARLSTLGDAMADVAESRHVAPAELCKAIRGDLDWIVMKAMEKDRTRRYQRAGDLAKDIERHLANVPVSAGPPSVGYRLHKFVRRNRAAVITVALVTAALAIGATTARFVSLTLGPSTPQHAEGMAQRHLWNLPHYATPSGTISSDAQVVSYIDWTAGNLGVHNISEDTSLLLTRNTEWAGTGGWAEYSVVSPDGRQVVFSWCREKENGFYDLRIVNTDGTDEFLLYRSDLFWWTRPCDWSADGQYVLACLADKPSGSDTPQEASPNPHEHLALISTTDASVQIIKTWYKRESPQAAFLSPDSLHVAYDLQQTDNRSHRDIYLLNLRDKSETALITHAADDRLLGWSPDGRWILFTSDRTGPRSLWAVRIADGKAAGPAVRLMQQFDGSPVGFTQENAFYYGLSIETIDAHIAALDGAGLPVEGSAGKVSTRFVGRTGNTDWSPDGKLLAFSIETASGPVGGSGPSQWALGILSVNTGQERLVTPSVPLRGVWGCCAPRWSPDGGSVLVFGITNEHGPAPYTINVTSGQVNLIKSGRWKAGSQAVWSADGMAVYVRARLDLISDEKTISRIDLTTGLETELYSGPWGPQGLDLSPDGQWLAFWNSETSLVVMPADGGEPRQVVGLAANEKNESISFVRWTPDGASLLFPKRLFELCKVDIQTGKQQPIGLFVRGLVDAAIHPDGRQIAFTAKQPGYQLWVMENFLPE